MILSGADNRPPMLDKDLYDSWKSLMELYMQNREHGIMILESVEHGPLIWSTVEENGVIRTKKYVESSAAEKIQADYDMKATNIILQGLPADIYSLEREDIQCAGPDTRPPMLDRTDFVSWQQCIRLYCRVKENVVNILKSIDEGPYQMGTLWEPLAEGIEGAPQFGPKRPRVYSDLSPEENNRYNVDIRVTNILLQRLPKDIYTLINHYTDAKDIWDNVKMLLEGSELTKEDRESQLYDDFEHFRQHKGESIHDYYFRFAKLINDMRNIKMTMSRMQLNSKFVNNMLPEGQGMNPRVGGAAGYGGAQNRVGNVNQGQARPVKCYNCNGAGHIARNCTQQSDHRTLNTTKTRCRHDNAFDDDVDEQPIQDLALNVDNVFQADDCDAFDSDVDEAPTAQTMFMANLSSADPVTDEAGP
nr:retrovirus-related Pol polyprotein from transposon TNT 1-94 [Tanacetum cinerariifolium]